MYLVEWMLWQGATAEKGSWASLEGSLSRFTPERVKKGEIQAEKSRKQRQSDTPRLRSPAYTYNDTYLEMRAGCMEYARGLISVVSLFYIYIAIGFLNLSYVALFKFISNPGLSWLLACIFPAVFAGVFVWFYIKYGLTITRFEMITQRRLLVRFNRKTRQVYLHRPKYAGGIVALPWDKVGVMTDVGGIRFPMMLAWDNDEGRPNPECCFVGKSSATSGPVVDEWEFIRRYMEEGPQGLPKPRLRTRWPMPWHGFEPVFGGMLGLLLGKRDPKDRPKDAKQWCQRIIGKILIVAALIMISPALLILGLANWLSQLLCWEPRWPKVIKEAGEPGKLTPKLTEAIDYDADTCRRLYLNADVWKTVDESESES